jgi:hypothetical protein
VTIASIKAVWKLLADCSATVMADTSMVTLSTANTFHFYNIYIDGKEDAKMTGDRVNFNEDAHACTTIHGL